MNWIYEYPSDKAVHRPTQLTFSITYDPVTPDRKIKLADDKPENLQNVDIDNLIKELGQVIHGKFLQRRMETLLYNNFNGEFARAAHVLEQETKKKVSTRTLQAWIIPQDRPSSRRCPEWAVVALEEYADRNSDSLKCFKDQKNEFQKTRQGRLHENRKLMRDRELLKNAESYIARKQSITNKWKNIPVSDFPEQLAKLETSIVDQLDSQSQLLIELINGLREHDTYEEFKREYIEQIENSMALERQIKDTALDIQDRRKEFASDDGVYKEY
ncbi:hypothetical protein [Vreelandella arcis]|uniref:Uncharacterized protein n=1 Tax=Vreelandella arcis TaxID=416873 RepID=A0A1H0JTL9_9GAMM|nr:hypothetical protein [Halomonas arcis]SDO47106.1 hypothetical protein SAMN04487951_1338 [Halomonas arcis]